MREKQIVLHLVFTPGKGASVILNLLQKLLNETAIESIDLTMNEREEV